MTRKLRVGLVSWAHVHSPGIAKALGSLEQVELTGLYDEEAARGRRAADESDLKLHDDLASLLRASEAVVVASTNADHRKYAEAAARAGVHVLSEKPLATTVEDGRAMVEAYRTAGVQLGTAFPVRESRAVIALRDSIREGSMGRVLAVRGTNPGQYPGRWFGDKGLAGGGAVMDHTVHVADALRWLLDDEVTRVQAEVGSYLWGLDVDDCGIITLDFAGGAFASIDCSWSRPRSYPTWGTVTLHVVGERATTTIDVFSQALVRYDDREMRVRHEPWGEDLTLRMIAGFVDAILEDRPVPISGEDGLRALEVAIAAYRSSELGRPVEIAEIS